MSRINENFHINRINGVTDGNLGIRGKYLLDIGRIALRTVTDKDLFNGNVHGERSNEMSRINENFLKLPGSYLFSTVGRKVREYQEANPDKRTGSRPAGPGLT